MKKITLIISALILSAFMFSSCEKEEDLSYYMYDHSFNLSEITTSAGTQKSEISEITNALDPRLNHVYNNLSSSQAAAEWQSFLNEIDESKLSFLPGNYYTVTFAKYVVKGNESVMDKIVGEKTWGDK